MWGLYPASKFKLIANSYEGKIQKDYFSPFLLVYEENYLYTHKQLISFNYGKSD